MAVVAVPPQQAGESAPSQQPHSGKPPHEKKKFGGKDHKDRKPKVRKEEAHLTDFHWDESIQPGVDIDFSYMVTSIPRGCAVLDTGGTTSLVMTQTAAAYISFCRLRV